MRRFMYDYRSNHFRRLGEDDSGIEFATADSMTEGSGVAWQGHDPDAFEIAYQTIVTRPIVRLDQAERLRHTPEFGIFVLPEPRPDPQPINLFALGLMQHVAFRKPIDRFGKAAPTFWVVSGSSWQVRQLRAFTTRTILPLLGHQGDWKSLCTGRD
jgi:hypothetical protein